MHRMIRIRAKWCRSKKLERTRRGGGEFGYWDLGSSIRGLSLIRVRDGAGIVRVRDN